MEKLLWILLTFISVGVLAQAPTCENAIMLCDGVPIQINPVPTDSISIPNDLMSTCGIGDMNLADYTRPPSPHQWFKYQATGRGTIAFTIRPDLPLSDLDFVAYRTTDGSCETAVAERCMFSGANSGDSLSSAPCLGPTGLRPMEVDSFERPNCPIGDNNFLEPMEVEAGEVVYLLVMVFTGEGYTVEYTGSAPLSCTTSSTYEQLLDATTTLYPNPTSGALTVESSTALIQVSVFNVTGRLVLEQSVPSAKLVEIDSADWPRGSYVVSTMDERGYRTAQRVFVRE